MKRGFNFGGAALIGIAIPAAAIQADRCLTLGFLLCRAAKIHCVVVQTSQNIVLIKYSINN